MAKTMKAAVVHEFGKPLNIEEVFIPKREPGGPDQSPLQPGSPRPSSRQDAHAGLPWGRRRPSGLGNRDGPFFPNCCENGRHLRRLTHLQRQEQLGSEFACKGFDIGFCLVVEVSYGEVRSDIAQRPGAAIGNRLVVGDAGDEPDLAGEQLTLGLGNVKASLGSLAVE